MRMMRWARFDNKKKGEVVIDLIFT
eukprot:SAG11_NODE_19300_length_469_cov_6.139085_1_plen_24_part_01